MYFSLCATTSLERFFIFWKKKTRWWTYWKTITHSLRKHFQEHFLAPKSKIIIKKSKQKKANGICEMPFAGIFFSVSISRMVLLSLWFGRVWMCSKVFSFFLFFLPVDLWMDRRDWQDQEKKKRLFLPVSVRERGEWIEANANPLLVCHYIVTFLYLQQSSGSFSRLIYWFFLHLSFFGWCLFFGIALFK